MDSKISRLIGHIHTGVNRANASTVVTEGRFDPKEQNLNLPFECNYHVYFMISSTGRYRNEILGHGDVSLYIDGNNQELKGALFRNCDTSFIYTCRTLKMVYGVSFNSLTELSAERCLFTF